MLQYLSPEQRESLLAYEKKGSFDQLTPDVLKQIFFFIEDWKTLRSVAQVNKHFQDVFEDILYTTDKKQQEHLLKFLTNIPAIKFPPVIYKSLAVVQEKSLGWLYNRMLYFYFSDPAEIKKDLLQKDGSFSDFNEFFLTGSLDAFENFLPKSVISTCKEKDLFEIVRWKYHAIVNPPRFFRKHPQYKNNRRTIHELSGEHLAYFVKKVGFGKSEFGSFELLQGLKSLSGWNVKRQKDYSGLNVKGLSLDAKAFGKHPKNNWPNKLVLYGNLMGINFSDARLENILLDGPLSKATFDNTELIDVILRSKDCSDMTWKVRFKNLDVQGVKCQKFYDLLSLAQLEQLLEVPSNFSPSYYNSEAPGIFFIKTSLINRLNTLKNTPQDTAQISMANDLIEVISNKKSWESLSPPKKEQIEGIYEIYQTCKVLGPSLGFITPVKKTSQYSSSFFPPASPSWENVPKRPQDFDPLFSPRKK